MADEAAGSAFNAQQYAAIYPPGVERHYWNRCRNRVIAHHLRRIRANGPMLEVGCGKGLVVAGLRARGFDITGVELAHVEPVERARPFVRVGRDVFALGGEESDAVRTILLLDVIEHLERPAEFIQDLRSKFPALEALVVTVPARQELFSNYDTFNGHYRRYDLGTVRQHLAPQEKERWMGGYFFHALYPAAWLQLRLLRNRPTRFDAPQGPFARALHALLGGLFHLEYVVLPRTWWGSSIIASVRKG